MKPGYKYFVKPYTVTLPKLRSRSLRYLKVRSNIYLIFRRKARNSKYQPQWTRKFGLYLCHGERDI